MTVYPSAIAQTSDTQASGQSRNIPFWMLFTIGLYIPFEEFVLKWLPVTLSVVLRFLPELTLYGLLAYVCINRIIRGYGLRRTPIDLLIAAFFASATVSIVLNGSGLFGSIVNLRTIWRYVSAFYIVVNIDLSKAQIRGMLRGLKIVMIIQGLLSSFQYFLPSGLNQAIFAPREFNIGPYASDSPAAAGTLKVGATAGTFSDSAVLSAFLLVGICFITASAYANGIEVIPAWHHIASFFTLTFGVFASKKRAALALALLIPFVVLYIYRRYRLISILIWASAVLVVLGLVGLLAAGGGASFSGANDRSESIAIGDYLLQVFSPDYWRASNEQARGWFATVILEGTWKTKSFFGFGPDFAQAQNGIRATLSTAADMAKLKRDEQVFDDPFWFSMFAYFGVVGTAIYALMLKRLYDSAKWLSRVASEPEYRALGGMFASLLFITVLYTFVERILRLRAFSFYFWLIGGMVVNVCRLKMAEISYNRANQQVMPEPLSSRKPV